MTTPHETNDTGASSSASDAPRSAVGAPEEFHGELKDYRQPLVTSLGIILGFLLSYLAGWANSSDGALLADGTDIVIFATVTTAVALLVWVLWRMLNPSPLAAAPLRYYRTTLRLYVVAIIVAFAGFLIAWVV